MLPDKPIRPANTLTHSSPNNPVSGKGIKSVEQCSMEAKMRQRAEQRCCNDPYSGPMPYDWAERRREYRYTEEMDSHLNRGGSTWCAGHILEE